MITFVLNSGFEIPAVGLGTFDADNICLALNAAIDAGYKHFDCARSYQNENKIGVVLAQAIASGKAKREELFITTKLFNDSHAKEDVERACRQSLADLQLTYLDLYLIHWPITGIESEVLTPSTHETWLAMESLVAKGLVRSIGVSNWSVKKLREMKEYATIFPAVNQVELHPHLRQTELLEACAEMGTHLTGYSPLGSPANANMFGYSGPSILENPHIVSIAASLNKSPAQVVIRWAVQRGTSVVPKSATPSRIIENFDVHTWSLSAEDMHTLNSVEPQGRVVDGSFAVKAGGPYKTVAELWDE